MKSLILSLLFASGCISGTVEIQRACDSKTITFPGIPAGLGTLPPLMQSFTVSLGEGKDLLTKVLLIDGELTRDNSGDLGFIDEIMISAAAPNIGGDDLVLWDSQHNMGSTLPVQASDANLVDYIDGNSKFTFNVTVSTQKPPTEAWNLTATLCVSAEINKTYP